MAGITTRTVDSDGLSIAVRSAGKPDRPAFVLLHGWPQCASTFDRVLELLGDEFFAAAPDLPGVGGSHGVPASGEKAAIAPHIQRLIDALGTRDVVLAGQDVGGMVAFACFRAFGARLKGGVILNTVIPGIDPWDSLLSDPRIWHFAFHAIPELPETVVTGHERPYFDYFFNMLTRSSERLDDPARERYTDAYRRPEALKAGFDWYRGMPADAKRNAVPGPLAMPLLYMRGDQDPTGIEAYLAGFRKNGVTGLTGKVIPGGHFSGDEAPEALAEALREFRLQCDGAPSPAD